MNFGILCPSEIAYRRFLPSLSKIDKAKLIGIGVNSPDERYGINTPSQKEINKMLKEETDKANKMICDYGGYLFNSYNSVISSSEIEAVYIPLPPALHFKWAKKALENGKHVLVDKPSTIAFSDTLELVDVAKKNCVALHENYMFVFHNQIDAINSIINSGEIGDIRLIRISFGFPLRSKNDFRYNKKLGGGANIDAGGYTLKYASILLGDTIEIKYANLNSVDGFEVDMFGSAILENNEGITAQVAFGMDNDYKCELEVWGSKGTLKTDRILTAPVGYVPSVRIKKNTEIEERMLPSDDSFKKSIEHFISCVENEGVRYNNYKEILNQAQLVEHFKSLAYQN